MTSSPSRRQAPSWVAGFGGAAGIAVGIGLAVASGFAFSRAGHRSNRR